MTIYLYKSTRKDKKWMVDVDDKRVHFVGKATPTRDSLVLAQRVTATIQSTKIPKGRSVTSRDIVRKKTGGKSGIKNCWVLE